MILACPLDITLWPMSIEFLNLMLEIELIDCLGTPIFERFSLDLVLVFDVVSGMISDSIIEIFDYVLGTLILLLRILTASNLLSAIPCLVSIVLK